MNTQRKRSKSKGRKYSPDEVDQRRKRRVATKKNAMRKRQQARYTPPPDTEVKKARKAVAALDAVAKEFKAWMGSPAALKLATTFPRSLPDWFRAALRELSEVDGL